MTEEREALTVMPLPVWLSTTWVGSEVKYEHFSCFRPISTWAGEEDAKRHR